MGGHGKYEAFDDDGAGTERFQIAPGDIEHKIQSCLAALKQQPRIQASGAKSFDKEGYLYKKRRRFNGWKRYYFNLTGEQLYYYTEKGASKPKGVIPISFMSYEVAKTEDKLVSKQMDEGGYEACKYRVTIYSPRRVYRLSAAKDEECESWVNVIENTLKANISEGEYQQKADAAKALLPLLEEQSEIQWQRYKATLKALEQVGFFSSEPSSKEKEGYLELQGDDYEKSWKKMYWVLYKDYLYYFRLENKEDPHGVIALKFISSVEHDRSLGSSGFVIQTPLRTFFVKAKHEPAMADCINVLHKLKAKSKRALKSEGYLEKQVQGQPVYGKLQLHYTINGKNKVFDISKNLVTIGRASSNMVKIKDRKISRNHCKIEVKNNVPVFHDLGSSRGSRVNSKRATVQALQPGDVIKVGETLITFTVKAKK